MTPLDPTEILPEDKPCDLKERYRIVRNIEKQLLKLGRTDVRGERLRDKIKGI